MRLSEAQQLQAAEMAGKYRQGASGGDLAAEYGLKPSTIYGRLKAAGVEMRDRKTAVGMAGDKIKAAHAKRRSAAPVAPAEASA